MEDLIVAKYFYCNGTPVKTIIGFKSIMEGKIAELKTSILADCWRQRNNLYDAKWRILKVYKLDPTTTTETLISEWKQNLETKEFEIINH